jgi:hypothetical protein
MNGNFRGNFRLLPNRLCLLAGARAESSGYAIPSNSPTTSLTLSHVLQLIKVQKQMSHCVLLRLIRRLLHDGKPQSCLKIG